MTIVNPMLLRSWQPSIIRTGHNQSFSQGYIRIKSIWLKSDRAKPRGEAFEIEYPFRPYTVLGGRWLSATSGHWLPTKLEAIQINIKYKIFIYR